MRIRIIIFSSHLEKGETLDDYVRAVLIFFGLIGVSNSYLDGHGSKMPAPILEFWICEYNEGKSPRASDKEWKKNMGEGARIWLELTPAYSSQN